MSELIDRETLIHELCGMCCAGEKYKCRNPYGECDEVTVIKKQPIIVTVQKMKYCKYCEDRAYTKKPFIVITPTGHMVDVCFNFCPNCGADMRKGCADNA